MPRIPRRSSWLDCDTRRAGSRKIPRTPIAYQSHSGLQILRSGVGLLSLPPFWGQSLLCLASRRNRAIYAIEAENCSLPIVTTEWPATIQIQREERVETMLLHWVTNDTG